MSDKDFHNSAYPPMENGEEDDRAEVGLSQPRPPESSENGPRSLVDLEQQVLAKTTAAFSGSDRLHEKPKSSQAARHLAVLEEGICAKAGRNSVSQVHEVSPADAAKMSLPAAVQPRPHGMHNKGEGDGRTKSDSLSEVADEPSTPRAVTREARNATRGQQPGAYAEVGGVRFDLRYSGINFATSGHSAGVEQAVDRHDSDTDSANLTEARPVTAGELEIPTAVEQSNDMLESLQEKSGRKTWVYLGVAVATLTMIVGTALIASTVSNEEEQVSPTMSPVTQSPSEAPSLSLESRLIEMLPGDTMEFGTPQYEALEWLLNDPMLPTYPGWRLGQRFALAALYLSTGGSRWIHNNGWLNYSQHECLWYSSGSFDNFDEIDYINVTHSNPCEEDPDASDARGVYRHIWLRENNLKGSFPTELFTLTSLRSINVQANRLTGTISSQLGQLTNLEALALVKNALSGTIPTEIGLLNKATGIWMIANRLEGTVPNELAQLSRLESLMLDQNALTGTVPVELTSLPGLLDLILADNILTGTIPTELGVMSGMLDFGLDGNLLTGTIPTELQRMSNAFFFYLSSNALTGTLPPVVVGRLTNARVLSLHDTKMNGPIPSEYGLLSELRFFSLFDNRLTGTIPTEFGLLENNLEWMLLHNNDIRGSIPSELGLLKNLTILTVQENALTGAVPGQLEELEYLNEFNVAGNMFSAVPAGILDLCTMSCDCLCHQYNATSSNETEQNMAHNVSL